MTGIGLLECLKLTVCGQHSGQLQSTADPAYLTRTDEAVSEDMFRGRC